MQRVRFREAVDSGSERFPFSPPKRTLASFIWGRPRLEPKCYKTHDGLAPFFPGIPGLTDQPYWRPLCYSQGTGLCVFKDAK
jgi:hypothetical protein